MNRNLEIAKKLDSRARSAAQDYLRLETELLNIIVEMDKQKSFHYLGFPSLFQYVTEELKLSPNIAYTFINVARKSHEVPELKDEIARGLSIYKAKKMTSVINKDNHGTWLQIAKEKTHKQLEREVAMAAPREAVRERMAYLPLNVEGEEKVIVKTSVPRVHFQSGVSEKFMLKFSRAKDLLSQKRKRNANYEATLEAAVDALLEKIDPIRKAERQNIRSRLKVGHGSKINAGKVGGQPVIKSEEGAKKMSTEDRFFLEHEEPESSVDSCKIEKVDQVSIETNASLVRRKSSRRVAIPANIAHQVRLRDRDQCRHTDGLGKRCSQRRYLEIHHIQPVAKGGSNDLSNLTTLCSGHHKIMHL